MNMTQNTCGTCKHIVVGDVNPQNVTQKQYQCRRFPPIPVVLAAGPQGINMSVMYPPVTPAFPACAEHGVKLQAANG